MLSLPLSDSPLREMFDVEQLAYRKWTTLADAKASAKRTFERHGSAIRSVCFIVLTATDAVQLVQIGPRGGSKVLWNFGKAHA